MKTIHRILYVMLIVVWSACADEHLPQTEAGRIVLNFSSGLSVSRDAEYVSVESALSHLDIFIWNLDGQDDEPNTIKHYERIHGPLASPTGSVSLQVQKNDFDNGKDYRMDVIANATASEETFKNFNQWADLRDAVQKDYRIQLTGGQDYGAVGPTIQDIPSHFLMDGVAKQNGSARLQLNKANSDDIQLSVILNRAAAKIEVRLKAGEGVSFLDTPEAKQKMGYYLRNLCYSTSLLSEATHSPILRKTDLFADAANIFFHWTSTQVSIAAYAYSHYWTSSNFFDNGTRMIVNLPVKYHNTDYVDNFYQILLTQGEQIDGNKWYGFNRNTHYIVEATINAPGAIDHMEPVELTTLRYSAKEWKQVDIEIGNDVRPEYLSVNKDTLDMHNIAMDANSLSFISSSAVTVTVEEAYYYNKFGQKVSVNNITGNGISATPDTGLSGNITVKSNVPTNNAIRYIRLKVTNKENKVETVLVRQYPLEYITNIQGYYSYRSDFGGTTYRNQGTNRYVATNGWDEKQKKWTYTTDGGSNDSYLFTSKYVSQENANGTSKINYYKWTKKNNNKYNIADDGNINTLINARMYHVRITSTSSTYKIGIPNQVDGYTDITAENNDLVSPSFMIASQLGATYSPTSVDQAASHCANYVEVYKDGENEIHLDNWRLPTEAEVKIIMKFQYVDNAAMDEVLSGKFYWSAKGTVLNEEKQNENSTQTAVRCIRDAY